MKKSLRLTLITGIILALLVSATGITASASCPLTSFFNRAAGGSSGSPFGNFASFFGNRSANTNVNAGGCPITNLLRGNLGFFGNANGNNITANNPPATNNCNANNSCTTNNCNANNTCTTGSCQPAPVQPVQPIQPPEPEPLPAVCSTYAEEVLNLVNEARTSRGLSALQLDEDLCAAAEVRAEEVLRRFSHTRPDGTSCFTVLRDFGIGYRVCGENIAKGFKDAQSVVNAWMNSSGHRANILNPNYTHMGVGKSGTGWGQLFIG